MCVCVCVCAGVLVCMCVCIGTRIYMCVCVIFAHYKMYHMHQIKPKEQPHYLINNACHIYNICIQSRLQTLPLSDWVWSKQTDFGERTLGDWVIYIILTDVVSPGDTDSGGACLCDINPLTDSAYGTELVKQVLVADGVQKSLQSNTINGTFSCNCFDCQPRSLNLLQTHRNWGSVAWEG